ncbi:uncharacterized protein LOC115758718 [Drosophila novamexicana]|uniref:uncharacterized protein LOC115758718 n=1 Tax=Drosophila novamexicana TaxID=47314 RepID=UPI0011E5C418|nr:uncharacterized protein LOC115758718 [Drosophila novamexicana]
MNLVWGHKGPYFHAPCQRDRFPSVLDELGEDGDKLVAHLGISNMSDMGARLKRGRKHTTVAEQRAADIVKESRVPLQKMFCSSAQGMRRGVDKYTQIPKYDPYVDEEDQRELAQRYRKLLNRPNPTPAQRQVGEPPYTGNCQHCRRRGSNDVANDFQGRLYLQQAYLLGQINLMVLDGQHQQQQQQHQQQQNDGPLNIHRNRNHG